MSVRSIWSKDHFMPSISLLIFYLYDLSTAESSVLKSPTNISLEFISLFRSSNICFINLGAPMGVHIYIYIIFFFRIDPFIII